MEVVSSCQVDGITLDVRRFLISNQGSSTSNELSWSQILIEQWREIFIEQESRALET